MDNSIPLEKTSHNLIHSESENKLPNGNETDLFMNKPEQITQTDDSENVNCTSDSSNPQESYSNRLKSIFISFLPLGLFAFGGPAAYAILHERFVEAKKWLNDELFLEYLALCQALPGPSATQLVVAIAFEYGDYSGGLIALILWNTPSFILLALVGIGMNELNTSKTPDWMAGLAPSAISLVFIAAYKLGNKCIFNNKKMNFNHIESDINTNNNCKLKCKWLNKNEKRFNILLVITIVSAIIILIVTAIKEEIISNQVKGFVYPFVIFSGGLCTYIDSLIPFRSNIYFKFREIDEINNNNNAEKKKKKNY
eukprot:470284_1